MYEIVHEQEKNWVLLGDYFEKIAPCLRVCASTSGGTGLIPGQGSKTPLRAVWCGQEKKNVNLELDGVGVNPNHVTQVKAKY